MKRKVFETNKLGNINLKNRFIRSAAGSGIASDDGFVTEHVKNWYRKVAEGGVSLIISEMMTAWDDGNFPENYLRIDEDRYIDSLKEVAEIVHHSDCKIIAQIGNYGSLLHWEPKIKPVGPSEVKDRISNIVPKPLSIEQINKVILHFAKSAMRAKKSWI
jgi:2,4-dienoyl-CoA reductase-like NADH-dependent reductase (Old Yellow Enzyme family)